MNFFIVTLSALILSPNCFAFSGRYVEPTSFAGNYRNDLGDSFQVLQNSSGKLTLIDLQTKNTFSVKPTTGMAQPFPLVQTLSHSPSGVEFSKYIRDSSLSMLQVSPSAYQLEFRVGISMPITGTRIRFEGTLVFAGKIESGLYEMWDPEAGMVTHKKMISSKLELMGLEDQNHKNADRMLFSGLNYLLKAYPSEGLESSLTAEELGQ